MGRGNYLKIFSNFLKYSRQCAELLVCRLCNAHNRTHYLFGIHFDELLRYNAWFEKLLTRVCAGKYCILLVCRLSAFLMAFTVKTINDVACEILRSPLSRRDEAFLCTYFWKLESIPPEENDSQIFCKMIVCQWCGDTLLISVDSAPRFDATFSSHFSTKSVTSIKLWNWMIWKVS